MGEGSSTWSGGDMKLCNYFSRRKTKERKENKKSFPSFTFVDGEKEHLNWLLLSLCMHTIVDEILKMKIDVEEWSKIYLISRCNLLHSSPFLLLIFSTFSNRFIWQFSFLSPIRCSAQCPMLFNNPS